MAQCRSGGRSAGAVDSGEINEAQSFRIGARWLSGRQFYSRGDRWNGDGSGGPGLVSDPYEAGLEPAGLVVRAGLDGVIRRDGGGRVVGVAAGGVGWGAGGVDTFPGAIDPQCSVVGHLLWTAKSWSGFCGNCGLVGCDYWNASVVLASQSAGGNAIHSISGLGQLCCSPKFHHLET